MGAVDALAGEVAIFKPQSAFFERFGSAGIWCWNAPSPGCAEAGALVLMDAKRGDIGSTMAGYAAAYLDRPRRWSATRSPSTRTWASARRPAVDQAIASATVCS